MNLAPPPSARGQGLPGACPPCPRRADPRVAFPMRRLILSLVCVLFMAGLVVAAEVTLVKFDGDKKEVTVKEGEKENTYKFAEKVKVTLVIDKDGTAKEGTLEA